MNLFSIIDRNEFNEMVANRYIDIAKHPVYDLWILDYSKSCSLDSMWNETTMVCRGMIIDANYDIVSWPFRKFFNVEELETLVPKFPGLDLEIPNLPFKAYEKLDGSLGIGYWVDGNLYIATKGSFVSDQAIKANDIFQKRYRQYVDNLDKSCTYLFEIIYPENRIVVDYGKMEDIILIGVKDTETGEDIPLEKYEGIFNIVKEYDCADWKTMREQFSGDNREGFVVRFDNGYRMKMKYEDYFKKHFLRSYLTEKHVFQFYYEGRLEELEDMTSTMDEENKITVRKMVEKFDYHYNRIKDEAIAEFEKMGYPIGTPMTKETAERIKNECKYDALVFRLVRGYAIDDDAMNQLKREIKFLEDEQN